MSDKIYWKGIEEKEQLEGFRALANKEFHDELPVLSSITEPISTGQSSRRDFLKMLGFSVTAATIAATVVDNTTLIRPSTVYFAGARTRCTRPNSCRRSRRR